jgi:hypothetical protein
MVGKDEPGTLARKVGHLAVVSVEDEPPEIIEGRLARQIVNPITRRLYDEQSLSHRPDRRAVQWCCPRPAR